MIEGYNADKCAQRNRIAALRDGVDSAPIKFLRQMPGREEPDGLQYARGTLPATNEEALARINASLPPEATPLEGGDVYIVYAEAANSNFVPDRYAFIDGSTLRNIAQDADRGIAFMNSHRVGSMSHPSELPFGRTFAGRYEKYRAQGDEKAYERTVMGFYMRKGIKPNGDSGPSTDDLYASIMSGTLFDVSVGLTNEGMAVCDLCGGDVRSSDCEHVPGTTRGMTEDQQVAQLSRGVKKGRASYTVVDDHAGELSGVYDGAIPGAGFRKAVRYAKDHKLAPTELAQARTAYAPLFSKGDLAIMDAEIFDNVPDSFFDKLKSKLGFSADGSVPTPAPSPAPVPAPEPAPAPQPVPVPSPTGPAQQMPAEFSQLQQEVAQLKAEKRVTAATAEVDRFMQTGKLLPVQRPSAIALFTQAMLDDEAHAATVTFSDGKNQVPFGSRVAALQAVFSGQTSHDLFDERIKSGEQLYALSSYAPSGKEEDDAQFNEGVEVGKKFSSNMAGGHSQNGRSNN